MSAVPERSRPEQKELFAVFPRELRSATFVSSEGRIYRLFSEDEETTLGESFEIDPAKPDPDTENAPLIFNFPGSFPDRENTAPSGHPVSATATKPPRNFDHPAPMESKAEKTDVPIGERLKRIRAVEGICKRHQTTLPDQVFGAFVQPTSLKTGPSVPLQPELKESPQIPSAVEKVLEERVTKTVDTKKKGEERKKSAATPLCRGVTFLGRPLFEQEKPETPNSIFGTESIPVLEREPDFFDVPARRKSVAPERVKNECGAVEAENAATNGSAVFVKDRLRTHSENALKKAETKVLIEEVLIEEASIEKAEAVKAPAVPIATNVEPPEKQDPPALSVRLFRLDPPKPKSSRTGVRKPDFVKPVSAIRDTRRIGAEILPETPQYDAATVPDEVAPTVEFAVQVVPQDIPVVEQPDSVADVEVRLNETATNHIEVHSLHVPAVHVDAPAWRPTWPSRLESLKGRAMEQIRLLSDHLESRQRRGTRIISFNGFHPGAGCTTMALCAARELASRELHVLLVDAHRQRPELAELLGVPFDPALYEIVSLEERLEFLPWITGLIEIEHENSIETRHFGELVGSMRNEFDLVLLDNGPLAEGPLAERVRLWQEMNSDGVCLVVNTKSPKPVNLEAVERRLRDCGVELIGIAENYVERLPESEA